MVHSYRKLSRPEYCLLWATFGAIMQWGLEAGIAAGIVLATLYFAWAYAKVGRRGCALRTVVVFKAGETRVVCGWESGG